MGKISNFLAPFSLLLVCNMTLASTGKEVGPAAPPDGVAAEFGPSSLLGSPFEIYGAVADECAIDDAGTDTFVDYDFPVAPQVDVIESVNGVVLGTYDLSFFFTDLQSTNKFLNFEDDFAFTQPDLNFVYTWVVNVYEGGELTHRFQITRDCGSDTAGVQRLQIPVSIPALSPVGLLLLFALIGFAAFRKRSRR